MDASHARCRRPLLMSVAALCAAALLGGCAGARAEHTTEAVAQRRAPASASNELQDDYQQVIKNVLPSVVQIQGSKDLGSGIVYDDQGHVVTNAHVVGKERTFRVTTAGSQSDLTARLVSAYPQQDLAVVKLTSMPSGLKAATFGDSSKAEVGQVVLAMGSPLGLSSSVTQGIVSAIGRTVSEGSSGDGDSGTGATIANMVQTSAAINPGNSGGALVGLDSKVIGIPTLAATDPDLGNSAAPGIGFAIPSHTVTTIADQIIKNGKVTNSGRAALDITARTVIDSSARPSGAAVVSARKGGAADDAGLREGDVITRLNNSPVTSVTSLAETLASRSPGERVRVTYVRADKRHTARVTLGEM